MKLSIGKKLALGFGILLVIVIIFGIFIVIKSQKNKNISDDIREIYAPSQSLINEYYTAIDNSKMLIKSWVFIEKNPDMPDKNRLRNLHDSIFPALIKKLEPIKEKWIEEDKVLVESITKKVNDSLFFEHKKIMNLLPNLEAYNDIIAFFECSDAVETGEKRANDGHIIKLTHKILDELNVLRERVNNKASIANETLKNSNAEFQTYTIVLLILLILVSVTTAFLTSRSILIPVIRLNNILNSMSKGEMPKVALVDTGDEIGEMSISLNNVIGELRKTIKDIKDSADFLANHSKTLTKQAKILSNGASEQATYVQGINASIERIVASLDTNAENSKLAETLVLNFVTSITDNSSNVSKTFDALNKISEKVNDVNDIAFQTNILSLNAAIEAARAGEQGKGFGIVAQEVGKLAERSKIHANEIENLSELSINIARTTDDASNELIPQIHKTQKLIGNITGAISDLSSGVNEIHKTAVNLNGIAQQNSAFSGDMSQNSRDLENQVAKLMQSVSFFKISDNELEPPIVDNKKEKPEPAKEIKEEATEIKAVEVKSIQEKVAPKQFIEIEPEKKKESNDKIPGFDLDLDDGFEEF